MRCSPRYIIKNKMEKEIKLTDSQFDTFKQHEPNIYNAVYFNMPPVFKSRDERKAAEAELYAIYLKLTGLTLNADCDMCECDNWKALGRIYYKELERRLGLPQRNKIKRSKKNGTKR